MPDLPTDVPGLTLDRVGELERAVIDTEACRGAVFRHGAHVAAWQPAGHEPVLWLSSKAAYADGKAIRGGVPVCFPWFGPKAGDPDAPAHGTVRTVAWTWAGAAESHAGLEVRLTRHADPFDVTLIATFGERLTTALTASLPARATTAATFEAALHTYFTVADAREVVITGLESAGYLDKMIDGGTACPATGEPIRFTAETDRVYHDTDHAVTLTDPGLGRRILVEKAGSRSTVVWNPWIDKAARMGDFGDDEWPGMCCIETAAIGPDAVTLEPGASHTIAATVSVAPVG